MQENVNWKPWDCQETFGKKLYTMSPGQAHLCQWPLKLSKVSPVSPFFHKAHLLIASDCSSFSYMNFHDGLLHGRVLTIGCPDIEGDAFISKIYEIVRLNDILSIRIVRMDAPCCKGLADAVIMAVKRSGKDIPIQVSTVFSEGEHVEG